MTSQLQLLQQQQQQPLLPTSETIVHRLRKLCNDRAIDKTAQRPSSLTARLFCIRDGRERILR
jgi:hypothetical protein